LPRVTVPARKTLNTASLQNRTKTANLIKSCTALFPPVVLVTGKTRGGILMFISSLWLPWQMFK